MLFYSWTVFSTNICPSVGYEGMGYMSTWILKILTVHDQQQQRKIEQQRNQILENGNDDEIGAVFFPAII